MTAISPAPILAHTLPADAYTSPDAYRSDREVVFARSWQLAGFSADLRAVGDFITTTCGDREFVVARAEDGQLNAFHNVCQHRGAAVASGSGCRRTLQCPYHGWTYRLNGELHRAPGLEPPPVGVRLRAAHVLERQPFVFLNPSPEPPDFEKQFGSLFAYLEDESIDLMVITTGERQQRQFEMGANWKVVMENSLECYHCGIAHPGLADTLDLDRYEHRIQHWWSVQGAPMRTSQRGATTALGEATRTAAVTAGFDFSRFIFLYPNLFLEIYPGAASFATLLVLPLDVERTRSVHTKFFRERMSAEEETEWDTFVEQVINEDIALCESVQRGLRSGALEHGLINLTGSGANEHCVGHFDALVAGAHA